MGGYPIDALTSCRRKIGRAEEHLLPVLEAYEGFKEGRPYAISHYYKPETRRYWFQILQLDEFDPIDLGLRVGDWAHNLSSALDHLVWGLASLNSRAISESEAREITFPIATDYRSFMKLSVIPHLTIDQIAVLEPYQPFKGRDTNKLLLNLNSLWNADKHQVIQSVVVALTQSGLRLIPNRDAGQILDRGLIEKVTLNTKTDGDWMDLGWVEISAPGPKPHVEVDTLTIQVEMGKRRVKIENLVPIGWLVSEIVEACAALFPQRN